MTEKQRRIVEKLQALIRNTPYAGEKSTAINVLTNYCLKNNIDLDSVEEERVFEYRIREDVDRINGLNSLLDTIILKYFQRKGITPNSSDLTYYRQGRIFVYKLKLLPADFFNIIAEYEFYAPKFVKSYKKELKKFKAVHLRAFLDRQKLLLKPDEDHEAPPMNAETFELLVDAERLSGRLEKHDYLKQLSARKE